MQYMGGILDASRSGNEHMDRAQRRAGSGCALISRVAAMLGTSMAKTARRGKMEPQALYGVAAIPSSGTKAHFAKLEAVTHRGFRATHSTPSKARATLALFEEHAPWATTVVALDEWRLQSKLQTSKQPLVKMLVEAPPLRGAAQQRCLRSKVAETEKRTGVVFEAATTKWGAKALTQRVKQELMQGQASTLKKMDFQATTIQRGRSSATSFKRFLQTSAKDTYEEGGRLAKIEDPRHRHVVRCLRMGLVKSKCEMTKGYNEGDGLPYRQSFRPGTTRGLECPCGARRQDSEHLLWECPRETSKKEGLLRYIREESRGTATQRRLEGLSGNQALTAALGGGLPFACSRATADDILQRAAPSVARVYGDMVSVPFTAYT